MIRRTYIERLVLDIYRSMPELKFPIDLNIVASLLPNCRLMSYQKLATATETSIEDIISVCQSKSGCTHYDAVNKRYLILFNQAENTGRKRWTVGHEIGHIMCGHHVLSAYDQLSENNILKNVNAEFELEADYFAATLLAPFPLYKVLGIRSATDVQSTFNISFQAADYRFNAYLNWLNTRKKTAWENDIIRIYKQKNI